MKAVYPKTPPDLNVATVALFPQIYGSMRTCENWLEVNKLIEA